MIIATIFFASMSIYSQKVKGTKTKEEPVNTTSNTVAYVDPVGTYERIAAKGYKTPQNMLLKVANACYFRSDLVSAAKWYGEVFANIPGEQEAVIYYRYAQCLKAIKDFTKADEMMAVYLKKRT